MKVKPIHIPLLIASGLVLISVINVFVLNLSAKQGLTYLYSTQILIALAGLAVVWLSILLKREIWVYVFLFLLIASFSDKIEFSSLVLNFFLGSLKIDMIAFTLVVSHVLLNIQSFRFAKSEGDLKSEFETKIDYFIKQYSKKTTDELDKINQTDIVPEAREAIKRLREI
jgi:hypothetical protein